ncbi:MAG: 50S ribosomal protein L32 [Alphaproteobacteria bacterium]|nr:50S ribosomal protein L32 [Alphaproteobacteria bacterium]
MAVPKKKKSHSRSSMRRGSNGTFDANFPNVVIDKESGDPKLSHHIGADGTYKGRQIIKKKVKKTPQE